MRYPETAALVKSARLRAGLTQEKAAVRVGCSRLQWINWEQGVHRPEKFAQALVDRVGIDPEKLKQADGGDDEDADLVASLETLLREIVRREVGKAVVR